MTENTWKLVNKPKDTLYGCGVFIIPANVIAPEGDDWGVLKGYLKIMKKVSK